MKFESTDNVQVVIPREALSVIFNECDRFDRDETGGRVIGSYEEQNGTLKIHVEGILESGPGAARSQVSFFQDGYYQESIFRDIEKDHPKIEHLGNWHTHHVNGLKTLSSGDLDTYHRIVNHKNHNTNFFYALLVTARQHNTKPDERYTIKHYLLRRGDSGVYEITPQQVELVSSSLVWPSHGRSQTSPMTQRPVLVPSSERVHDSNFLGQFYKELRPYTSKTLGVYWRGPVELIDRSSVEVVVLEDSSSTALTYSVTLREPQEALASVAKDLSGKVFSSARLAAVETERACNRALFEYRTGSKEKE